MEGCPASEPPDQPIPFTDYFGTDLGAVWETLRSDLPALISELRRVLDG
jgi:uncharacterized protein with HEPN domain